MESVLMTVEGKDNRIRAKLVIVPGQLLTREKPDEVTAFCC